MKTAATMLCLVCGVCITCVGWIISLDISLPKLNSFVKKTVILNVMLFALSKSFNNVLSSLNIWGVASFVFYFYFYQYLLIIYNKCAFAEYFLTNISFQSNKNLFLCINDAMFMNTKKYIYLYINILEAYSSVTCYNICI